MWDIGQLVNVGKDLSQSDNWMCVESDGSKECVFSFRGRGHFRSYTCTLGFRRVVGSLTITGYAREVCAWANMFKL